MKKIIIALFVAMAMLLVACGSPEASNEPTVPATQPAQDDTPTYTFNEPLLDYMLMETVITARYFSAWGGHEVADVYAVEYAAVQATPALRTQSLAPNSGLVEVVVIDNLNGLEDRLTWIEHYYMPEFFEDSYLVAVQVYTPHLRIEDVVYRIDDNGTITFRPLMQANEFVDTAVGQWLVLVELGRNFTPRQFQVEFIDNPWAT